MNLGQNTSVLDGKILRISPRAGGGYSIPSDNPFVGSSGKRAEIWAYGLRNPWRFSFDRLTGALAIGDVGQDKYEEIDFAARGTGEGRQLRLEHLRGQRRFKRGNAPGAVFPVLVAPHSAGYCAIIGGYVVRDHSLPSLYGRYVFGDDCKSQIHSVKLSPRPCARRTVRRACRSTRCRRSARTRRPRVRGVAGRTGLPDRSQVARWQHERSCSTCSGRSSTGARGSPRHLTQAASAATRSSSPTTGASATCRSSPRSTARSGRGATSTSCTSSRSTTCSAGEGWMLPTTPGTGSWRRGMRSTHGPDVKDGLEQLRGTHVVATLSNGHVAMLVDLARHGDLRFDCVLSAELARAYKPDPAVYLGAARLLALDPGEVMLVGRPPLGSEGSPRRRAAQRARPPPARVRPELPRAR